MKRGTTSVLTFTDRAISQEAAQSLLQAQTVEVVQTRNGNVLLVDEDGLLKGLPVNPAASVLADSAHVIVGNALYLATKEARKGWARE